MKIYPGILLALVLHQPVSAEELLDAAQGVKRVADGCKFTEGPASSPSGELYFSDIENNRIVRLERSGLVREFRRPSGRANGIVFDHEGRLVMCQGAGPGGGRRVARLEKDGSETVLAASYAGKKFIAPNDLCIDRKGRIYFTDPYYGPPAEKSQPSSGVRETPPKDTYDTTYPKFRGPTPNLTSVLPTAKRK